jgi:hypothetical protein
MLGGMPANKQLLTFGGPTGEVLLKNATALAEYNMNAGAALVLTVKTRGRRR